MFFLKEYVSLDIWSKCNVAKSDFLWSQNQTYTPIVTEIQWMFIEDSHIMQFSLKIQFDQFAQSPCIFRDRGDHFQLHSGCTSSACVYFERWERIFAVACCQTLEAFLLFGQSPFVHEIASLSLDIRAPRCSGSSFGSLLRLHECSSSLDSLNNAKENAFCFWLFTTLMPLVGRVVNIFVARNCACDIVLVLIFYKKLVVKMRPDRVKSGHGRALFPISLLPMIQLFLKKQLATLSFTISYWITIEWR